ncbi:MAG: FAD-binding oxidoreductase [Hyphomicrobiales bacterium]|nr:FAD-binding oxidoreductase [Hyphomicrobiales bacterium]MCY4048990.1 FAD-binding oxidoreductase [Hyphomicrobiales bacterium]
MLFGEDFRTTSFWRDDVAAPAGEGAGLPGRADVLVVGGGYTGMSAALELARGGREVVVVDGNEAGWGCSSRNGGQVSEGVKPDYAKLARSYGGTRAREIILESERALFGLCDFIETENIDCDFRRCGRFHGAHTRKAFERLAREVEQRNRLAGRANGAYMVGRAEQSAEIGTQAYYGGAVFPEHASVHPAKLLHGIEVLARGAGANVVPRCAAETIERESGGFCVKTQKGEIACRNIVLATNGYTGKLSPWHRRRIIPVGSYIIATEPLDPGIIERALPKDRVFSDTRKIVYYYRASPDRRRMLFGGRVSCNETDPRVSAPLLHAEMSRLFPELKSARVSHSWCGFVAFTFDRLMHAGCFDGIHYAAGYCGSGIALSVRLGTHVARQILGKPVDSTVFGEIPFPTAPFYTGNPWWLSGVLVWYKCRDTFPW